MWSFGSRLLKDATPGFSAKGNGAGRIQTYAEQAAGTNPSVEIDRAGGRKGKFGGPSLVGKQGECLIRPSV